MADDDSTTQAHHTFLQGFDLAALAQSGQKVVCVSHETSVEEALALLRRFSLLSMPVYDTQEKEFVGLVNLFDIATAICFQSLFKQFKDRQLDQLTEEEFTAAQQLDVFHMPVAEALGLSEESKTLWVYNASDKLQPLLEVFSKGVHRVLVRVPGKLMLNKKIDGVGAVDVDTDDEHVCVLSQTDVVRFLYTSKGNSALQPIFDTTIDELGLIKPASDASRIVTLDVTSSALTGFQKLTLHDVSALAVVDQDGKLVSTLSAADVRNSTKETFQFALMPVLDFKKATIGEHKDLVTCQSGDTLHSVVASILKGHVHRSWIVNELGKPIGVITLTDIINIFSPYRF